MVCMINDALKNLLICASQSGRQKCYTKKYGFIEDYSVSVQTIRQNLIVKDGIVRNKRHVQIYSVGTKRVAT